MEIQEVRRRLTATRRSHSSTLTGTYRIRAQMSRTNIEQVQAARVRLCGARRAGFAFVLGAGLRSPSSFVRRLISALTRSCATSCALARAMQRLCSTGSGVIPSLIVATVGAILLLFIVGLFQRRRGI